MLMCFSFFLVPGSKTTHPHSQLFFFFFFFVINKTQPSGGLGWLALVVCHLREGDARLTTPHTPTIKPSARRGFLPPSFLAQLASLAHAALPPHPSALHLFFIFLLLLSEGNIPFPPPRLSRAFAFSFGSWLFHSVFGGETLLIFFPSRPDLFFADPLCASPPPPLSSTYSLWRARCVTLGTTGRRSGSWVRR